MRVAAVQLNSTGDKRRNLETAARLVSAAAADGAELIGLLFGLPSGFASDSLPGSLGAVTVVEALLVLGTLVSWLLAN